VVVVVMGKGWKSWGTDGWLANGWIWISMTLDMGDSWWNRMLERALDGFYIGS
jgi:hypothetical protein